MNRHKIALQELDEWIRRPQWQAFASSANALSRKKLEVDGAAIGGPIFRVIDRGETIFLGADMAAAVAAYNEAP